MKESLNRTMRKRKFQSEMSIKVKKLVYSFHPSLVIKAVIHYLKSKRADPILIKKFRNQLSFIKSLGESIKKKLLNY